MAMTMVVAVLSVIEQLEQVAASADDYMVANLPCAFIYKGDVIQAHITVKQITGSKFDDPNNIEVGKPTGYDGPYDWGVLAGGVEAFYKSRVGREGSLIKIADTASDLTMTNNFLRGKPYAIFMPCEV
jgi:hypothetical protein